MEAFSDWTYTCIVFKAYLAGIASPPLASKLRNF